MYCRFALSNANFQDPNAVEYCTWNGNMTNGGRLFDSFSVSDGTFSSQVSSIQTSTSSAVFFSFKFFPPLLLYSFIDFITTINQSDFLSKELIMLINILLIGYVLKNSLLNMARFSQVVFILIITLIILLFIAGIGDIDFSNLLPLISKNTENKTNILNLIVQPFLELTLLYNVFCKIKTKEKYKKNIFLIVSVISLIVLLVISIESIGLLGDDYYAYLNYPYYSAMSCINMSKIVIKIESLSLIVVYFSSFIKLVFIVYNAILGINIILNNKKNYYFPYLMFIHVLSLIMFDNIYEMMEIKCYYSLIFFTFIILIPILINMKNDKIDNKNIMQYT